MSSYKLVDADQLDSDLAAIGDAIRSKGGTVEALSFPGEMVSAISAISTGVELNFEVVSNPQPSVAKENTIWVDTYRINNYYFSATQPKNMVNYDVWFPVGTSSPIEFNALKKGGIQVYPLSAKQMISGALVDKTAKSWQGDKWIEWITDVYLYKPGDECIDVTGGWTANGYAMNGIGFNTSGVIKSGSGITTKGVSGSKYGGCGTEVPVYIKDQKFLYVIGKKNSTGDEFAFISKSKELGKDLVNTVATAYFEATETPLTIPLAGISGEYYIGWLGECTVTEVKLA